MAGGRAYSSIRRKRAAAQLLAGSPAASADQVARRLLAVQSQMLRAGRLAVRARSAGLTAAGVNHALGEARSVVISWLCRGTLHLVCRDDYPWLLALTAPTQLRGNLRRLEQLGVSPDRADAAVRLIERTLAAEGPLTRSALAERLATRGVPTAGQVMVHLLLLASLRGITIRGPLFGAEQAFVLTRDWLGRPPRLRLSAGRRDQALAELARRYLTGHGPASAADLALWAGLPLRDARAGLDMIAGQIEAVEDGLLDIVSRPSAPTSLPARLLPAFDAYLLGWKNRTFGIGVEHMERVRPEGGGMVRATATVDGLGVANWATSGSGARMRVEFEWWRDVADDDRASLTAEAADVVRFQNS